MRWWKQVDIKVLKFRLLEDPCQRRPSRSSTFDITFLELTCIAISILLYRYTRPKIVKTIFQNSIDMLEMRYHVPGIYPIQWCPSTMDPLRIRQEIKRTTMLAAQISRGTHTHAHAHGFTIQRKCNMETKRQEADGAQCQWGTRQASQCPRRCRACCWLH